MGRGQTGRRGVRDVVRHVPDLPRVEPGQRAGQELRRPLRVRGAQVVPRIGEAELLGRPGQRGVERVGHHVDVGRGQPALGEAPGRRLLRQLPGRERNRALSVLAPAEALLLRRRDDLAVHDERGRRVVIDRVDAEHPHTTPPNHGTLQLTLCEQLPDGGVMPAPSSTVGRKPARGGPRSNAVRGGNATPRSRFCHPYGGRGKEDGPAPGDDRELGRGRSAAGESVSATPDRPALRGLEPVDDRDRVRRDHLRRDHRHDRVPADPPRAVRPCHPRLLTVR